MKIGLLFSLLACLVMPWYGYLIRWTPADQALSRYQNDTAVMVAGSYRSHSAISDGSVMASVSRERVYILLPSMFSQPKTLTISQKDDEPFKVSEDQNGVFHMLMMYGLILFGVWWFWVRRPNKS